MVCEIISVGTEILLGNIVNTNAAYISARLAEMGIEQYYQTVVGDNPARIRAALDIAFSRADMVITTGGLGPTRDDLTKEMFLEYMGFEPVLDEKALSMLEERLQRAGVAMSPGLRKQAMVPRGARVLYNRCGTAPGCVMERDGKICILLPGPPREMKAMFDELCADYLSALTGKVMVSVNIYLLDFDHAPVAMTGEGPVSDRLGDLLDGRNPTCATYAGDRDCHVRLTAMASGREEARALLEPLLGQCEDRIGREWIREVVWG